MDQQDRCIGPVRMAIGRDCFEIRLWPELLQPAATNEAAAPALAHFGFEGPRQIGHWRNRDRAFVEAILQGHARKRCIAAVTCAHDASAIGIDNSSIGQRGQTIRDVGLHFLTPFAFACLNESTITICGAPKIGLEHRIAARGNGLRPPVESLGAMRLRAAMRQHDQGQVLCLSSRRQRQYAVEFKAILGLILKGRDWPHILCANVGAFAANDGRSARCHINIEPDAAVLIAS